MPERLTTAERRSLEAIAAQWRAVRFIRVALFLAAGPVAAFGESGTAGALLIGALAFGLARSEPDASALRKIRSD